MKILVVDDDRELVDLLTYCLRGFGYEVVRAFDGAHALKSGASNVLIWSSWMSRCPNWMASRSAAA